jgi:RNA polymerase sigma factor (sigma-70 family)
METKRQRRLTLVAQLEDKASSDGDQSTSPSSPARDIDWSILMARAQEGDTDAYQRLLHEISPYLRALIRKWHKDHGTIEDTVQEILLTVHSIRHTYDPARPFGPWLVGIANRRAIDSLRRKVRQARREVPLDPEHDNVASSPHEPYELLAKHHLNDAIGELPPNQQMAVNLLKIQEMSLKDASTKSGLSIAALKMAMHRAMKNLRSKIADRGGM